MIVSRKRRVNFVRPNSFLYWVLIQWSQCVVHICYVLGLFLSVMRLVRNIFCNYYKDIHFNKKSLSKSGYAVSNINKDTFFTMQCHCIMVWLKNSWNSLKNTSCSLLKGHIPKSFSSIIHFILFFIYYKDIQFY